MGGGLGLIRMFFASGLEQSGHQSGSVFPRAPRLLMMLRL